MFPKELRAKKQWVCWRLEPDKGGGKPGKVPINPFTGKGAMSNNPSTWTDYDTAVDAAERYGYTGIGYMFAKGGGIVGVDIDHCYDPETGEFNQVAATILAKQPTYHAENTHEAIVSMKDYQAVQTEMVRRSAKHNKITRGPAKYPFTSLIVCGNCGKGYQRKMTRTGPVWICSTYNIYGKSVCPSKQIPEGTLERVAAEVLGLDVFDADMLHSEIAAIRAESRNMLVFCFKDGSEKTVHWTDRSRSESWTLEMRAAASKFAKKGWAMRSCQQER